MEEQKSLKLHWFLVTSLNDTELNEEKIFDSLKNENVTVAALDNMPAVILDWRGLAALCEEYIPEEQIREMTRLDFETMGAMVKNQMNQEILNVYSRISDTLKNQIIPSYLQFKREKEENHGRDDSK